MIGRSLFAAALAANMAVAASAQENPEPKLIVEGAVRVANKLVLPAGIVAYNQASVQPEANLIANLPKLGRLVATYWLNMSLNGNSSLEFPREAGQRSEADYILTFAPTIKKVELAANLSHFDIYDVGKITEVGIAASIPGSAHPKVTFVQNFSPAALKGRTLTASVNPSIAIAKNITLDGSLGVAFSNHYILPESRLSMLQGQVAVTYTTGPLAIKLDYGRFHDPHRNSVFARTHVVGMSIRASKALIE